MQITNHVVREQQVKEQPLVLREGEVYRASIKERLPNNEAILQIRGKEVHAKFDRALPTSDRVTIEIGATKNDVVQVKTIAEQQRTTHNAQVEGRDVARVLRSLGGEANPSPELRQALQTLLDKGVPLTRETVRDLQAYMNSNNYTTQEKIATINAMANKRLETTSAQIRAVHEALHGKPLGQVLTDLAKELDPNFKFENHRAQQQTTSQVHRDNQQIQQLRDQLQQTREQVQREPNVQRAVEQVREQIVNNREIPREIRERVAQAVEESARMIQRGDTAGGRERLIQALSQAEQELSRQVRQESQPSARTVDQVQQVREQVQREPNVQRAVEQVREQIVNNREIPREIRERVSQAVEESARMIQRGDTAGGRERLVQALSQAEQELSRQVRQESQPSARTVDQVQQVREQVQREPNVQRAVDQVREQIVNNREIPREIRERVAQAVEETTRLIQRGDTAGGRERLVHALSQAEQELSRPVRQESQPSARTVDQVQQVREQVQREPNVQRAVEQVREQIVNNREIPREIRERVSQAVEESARMIQRGDTSGGRERLVHALSQAEQELSRQVRQESQPQSRTVEQVQQVREQVQREPNVQRAVEQVREQIVNNREIPREIRERIAQAVEETTRLIQRGDTTGGRERLVQALSQAEQELSRQVRQESQPQSRTVEQVQQVREQVQREPNVQRAVEQVREQIVNNREIPREIRERVSQAVEESARMIQRGDTTGGRERLVQALTQAEQELSRQVRQESQSSARTVDQVQQVREQVQREPNVQRAVDQVREQIVNNREIPREIRERIAQAVEETTRLIQRGDTAGGRERLVQALSQAEQELSRQVRQESQPQSRTVEQVQQVREQVQREPNVQRAVEQVREQIVNNREIPREIRERVSQAVEESARMIQRGDTTGGRERLVQALSQAEQELSRQVRQESQPQSRTVEQVQQVREQVQREPNVQRAVEQVREQIVNNREIPREIRERVAQAVEESSRMIQRGDTAGGRERLVQALSQAEQELSRQVRQESQPSARTVDQVQQVREQVQREPNVQRAVDQVREQIVNNREIPREIRERIAQAVEESVRMIQRGDTTGGRERLVQALSQAEQELSRQVRQESQPQSRTVEQVQQVREQVQREPNVQRAVEQVREQIVNNREIPREIRERVAQAVEESSRMIQRGDTTGGRERLVQALSQAEQELSRQVRQESQPQSRTVEQVQQVREQVQREPNVQRAVEQVREQIVNNREIPREIRERVAQAVEETTRLIQRGDTSGGRERLVQALSQAEQELTRQVRQEQQQTSPRTSEQVQQVREQVQRDPNLHRAIDEVRNKVTNNPALTREQSQTVEKATREATFLQQTARDRMLQAISQLENHPAFSKKDQQSLQTIRQELQQGAQLQRAAEQLRSIISESSLSETEQKNFIRQIRHAEQIEQAGRERLTKAIENVEKQLQRMERHSNLQNENTKSTTNTNQKLSEVVRQAIQTLQNEGDFAKAIEQIRQQISNHPNVEQNMLDELVKTEDMSKNLAEQGREMAARQMMMNTLQQIQQQASSYEQTLQTQETNSESQQYVLNEEIQAAVQLSSKDIAVTTITQKLAEATVEFKKIQRDITKNLDTIQRLINQYKNQATPQVKPLLETTIKQLDNAILKSEMMLWTDMKTEKKLMQASSQLAEARKLLMKGNYQEANRIVQEVKALVERVNFKPSETKIMHFVSESKLQKAPTLPTGQQLLQQVSESVRYPSMIEPSARQTFEMIRGLGLNRDNEIGQMLANLREHVGEEGQQQANRNLKAALMQLIREEEGSRIAQQANSALNNLTGQQLLSKSDSGNLQSMFFNIPFLLQDKVENLQVFVNSRNEGEQVDWENCNLYFLIETPKLGEIGILVNVVERNLSITLKNDQDSFQERMEPLVDTCLEKIEEIGYNINGIKFTKMTTPQQNKQEDNSPKEETVSQQPIFTEKGFDFKV